jgi:hypothetical protein
VRTLRKGAGRKAEKVLFKEVQKYRLEHTPPIVSGAAAEGTGEKSAFDYADGRRLRALWVRPQSRGIGIPPFGPEEKKISSGFAFTVESAVGRDCGGG